MYNELTTTQPIADAIKRVLLRRPVSRSSGWDEKRLGTILNNFEATGWHSAAFEDVMSRHPDMGDFVIEEGGRVEFLASSGDLLAVREAVSEALRDYTRMMLPSPLLGTRDAAMYLGIGYDQMKNYASREPKRIEGQLIGKTLVFSREELDRFDTEERRAIGSRKAD
jgi:hypothetical protein